MDYVLVASKAARSLIQRGGTAMAITAIHRSCRQGDGRRYCVRLGLCEWLQQACSGGLELCVLQLGEIDRQRETDREGENSQRAYVRRG